MASLDSLPGIMPVALSLLFFAIYPADGCGIEYDLGPAKSCEPCRLGKPLVKADEPGDPAKAGIVNSYLLTRGEVALLIEERVVGNMRLAIDWEKAAVGVDHSQRVVVASFVLLEYGNYND